MGVVMEPTRAFITGSHAYGEPTAASDIDIVVLMTSKEMFQLQALAEIMEIENEPHGRTSETSEHSVSIRFGRLNLIVCSQIAAFQLWKDGTDVCRQARPVTRDHAVHIFRRLRAERFL
jgi:hypothetical protein